MSAFHLIHTHHFRRLDNIDIHNILDIDAVYRGLCQDTQIEEFSFSTDEHFVTRRSLFIRDKGTGASAWFDYKFNDVHMRVFKIQEGLEMRDAQVVLRHRLEQHLCRTCADPLRILVEHNHSGKPSFLGCESYDFSEDQDHQGPDSNQYEFIFVTYDVDEWLEPFKAIAIIGQ